MGPADLEAAHLVGDAQPDGAVQHVQAERVEHGLGCRHSLMQSGLHSARSVPRPSAGMPRNGTPVGSLVFLAHRRAKPTFLKSKHPRFPSNALVATLPERRLSRGLRSVRGNARRNGWRSGPRAPAGLDAAHGRPRQLVTSLQDVSSRHVRSRGLPEVKRVLWDEHFWSPSYFVSSTGGAALAKVKAYNQQKRRPEDGASSRPRTAGSSRLVTIKLRLH